MLKNAKYLRTNQTDAEKRLWYHLRAHRFMGLKFKRQKPIGRTIVDFVCMERGLVIELDGGQHADATLKDQQRDAWLRSQGYTVLRFWNNEVMQQLEGVLERIRCVGRRSPSALKLKPENAWGGVKRRDAYLTCSTSGSLDVILTPHVRSRSSRSNDCNRSDSHIQVSQ